MIIFFDKKRWCSLLLSTALLLSFLQTDVIYAKEDLRMYSGSYALTDGRTSRVLAGKNETSPMANASTTKILTCIVALENCNLTDMVTISANAASQPKVRLGMGEGEQYPFEDMLYGLMLESYNDCAVAIAEHVAGSQEEFAQMLNKKAAEIGCLDTYFITPNGLDANEGEQFHHTTAWDLCKIMAYCVWESPKKDTFLKITQQKSYNGSSNGNEYSFTNRNVFLDQMDGVVSGKTGYTSKAGYCYVAAFEKDGERFCISLLACGWPNNRTYKWSDARTLLNHGIENYHMEEISIEEISEAIEVEGYVENPDFGELNQQMKLKVTSPKQKYSILLSEKEHVKKEVILYTDIELPIKKGQVLGVCNVYLNDIVIDSISLVAEADSDKWSFEKIWQVILNQFFTFSF